MLPSTARSRTRTTMGMAAAAIFALTLLLSSLAGAAAEDGHDADQPLNVSVDVTDHGAVATEVSTSISAVGTLPDGREALYLPSAGEPASLSVVDIHSGELIAFHEIGPKSLAGAIEVLPDGSAYFALRDGGGVILYHWNPVTDEVEQIVENPAGESVIRGMRMEDGILYGSTYPRSKVFAYDPETGSVRDYGSVTGDDSYADGFAVKDGIAYVGTGMEVGHAFTLDLETGEIAEMEVPEGYDDALTRFYSFQEVGDLVAMAFSPSIDGDFSATNTLFWDTTTEEWVCEGAIPGWLTLNSPFSAQTAEGQLFYKSEGEIWEFDSTDCSVTATGWIDSGLEETGDHRSLSLQAIPEGDSMSYRLIGLNRDSSFWTFDPTTGEHSFVEAAVPAPPLTAHSLHVGLDGRVYMGTYNGPGVLGRFDPASAEMEKLEGPSQADSWLNFGDEMLVGSYGNAVVHSGDPTQEWSWGENPEEQFRLIEGHEQDRIIDMATNGELAALGSVSDYGISGGALTLLDAAGNRETYRDLVDSQSTTSLAFGEHGLLYAGTAARGGIDGPASPLDAHLVVFDPESREVVDTLVPVEGNDVIAGLTVVGDSIWGVTNSSDLFEFDTTTGEVVQTHDLGVAESKSTWGLASTVQLHPDGFLYGIAGTEVFAFDPETGQQQILLDTSGYVRMDIADDGTIYVIDSTNLYELEIESDTSPPLSEQVQDLGAETTTYIDEGQIEGSLATRLENAASQALAKAETGHDRAAMTALRRYARYLENPNPADAITDEAREELSSRVDLILGSES